MKRLILLVLALSLMLGLVSVSSAEEISGRLVLYSSMTDNDLNNLIDGFTEIYPDV